MTQLSVMKWSLAATASLILLGLGCSAGHEPGAPPVLSLSKDPRFSGDQQSGTTGHLLLQPLKVVVKSGITPATGIWVGWLPDAGSGFVTADSTLTDSTGTAEVLWRMPTEVGSARLQATVPGATGSPQEFTAQVVPNFPFRLEHVFGDGAIAQPGSTLELLVRVGDQFDNDFPGATITWTVVSGPAVLMGPTSVSGSDGVATMAVTLGPATGQAQIEASHPSVGVGSPVVMTITVQ